MPPEEEEIEKVFNELIQCLEKHEWAKQLVSQNVRNILVK